MDVLITGGAGTVGTAITEHLGDRDDYGFTSLDVAEHPDPDVESVIADVTDYDAIRPHFDGHDAVVHLALIPGTGGHRSNDLAWSDALSANLEAHNNVFAAATEAGHGSLVFASSNHAVGLFEDDHAPECYYPGSDFEIDHTVPHRPDSLYGMTKAYGEDLGQLAAATYGIRFYGLRIGTVMPPEWDHPWGLAERGVANGDFERGSEAYDEQVARMRGTWNSRRDIAHLIDCCLRDGTVTWDVFYGASDNDRGWFDIDHAREVLGYDPQDDGEEWDERPA